MSKILTVMIAALFSTSVFAAKHMAAEAPKAPAAEAKKEAPAGMSGMEAKKDEKKVEKKAGELLGEITQEDLLKYGFIPEFIGRLPVLATLTELDEDAMVQILKEPKNALVKQYQKLFEMEHVKLKFTDGSLSAIAKEALKRNTGARGLRSILENAMLDIMYEIPSQSMVKEVIINEEVILRKEKPIVVYEGMAETA